LLLSQKFASFHPRLPTVRPLGRSTDKVICADPSRYRNLHDNSSCGWHVCRKAQTILYPEIGGLTCCLASVTIDYSWALARCISSNSSLRRIDGIQETSTTKQSINQLSSHPLSIGRPCGVHMVQKRAWQLYRHHGEVLIPLRILFLVCIDCTLVNSIHQTNARLQAGPVPDRHEGKMSEGYIWVLFTYQLCFPTVGGEVIGKWDRRLTVLSTHKPKIRLLCVLWLRACLFLRWPVAANVFWNGHARENTRAALFPTVSCQFHPPPSVAGSRST